MENSWTISFENKKKREKCRSRWSARANEISFFPLGGYEWENEKMHFYFYVVVHVSYTKIRTHGVWLSTRLVGNITSSSLLRQRDCLVTFSLCRTLQPGYTSSVSVYLYERSIYISNAHVQLKRTSERNDPTNCRIGHAISCFCSFSSLSLFPVSLPQLFPDRTKTAILHRSDVNPKKHYLFLKIKRQKGLNFVLKFFEKSWDSPLIAKCLNKMENSKTPKKMRFFALIKEIKVKIPLNN